jgi:hypothetical protein
MTLEYDLDMAAKVRRTLTLDADVAGAFDDDRVGLTAFVNAALRAEVQRRVDRRAALKALADDLDARYGPADPEAVAYFEDLLRQ